MRQLWNDCDGGILSTELLLVSSVLVAGLSTGLTSVRDAVTSEFNDVAHSIQNLNQSYLYTSPSGPSGRTAGSSYYDRYEPVPTSGCIMIDQGI